MKTAHRLEVAARAVLRPARSFGETLTQSSLFKTDAGGFNFRREAAELEPPRSFLHGGLRPFDVDILGFFSDLGQDRHFGRRHLGISPEHRHVVSDVSNAVAKLSDLEGGEKV